MKYLPHWSGPLERLTAGFVFCRALCSFCALVLLPSLAAAKTPVAVSEVTQVELQAPVQLVGSVLPLRTSAVSAQVSGVVDAIWVDEGTRTQAGEKLLQLDDELARIEVDRRQAQLAQAQAELVEAERRLAEAQRLRKDEHIPQSALETAQSNAAVAAAVVDQNQAALAAAEENLERHLLTAPFGGVVTRKMAELGQWLNTGSAALELVDTQAVRIEVAVPQANISAITIGTQASVRLEAFPGKQLKSNVSAIIPRDVNAARTIPVWLEVPNSDGQILPGMSARVALGLASQAGLALAVQNDALVRRVDGSVLVWVVKDGEPDLTVQSVAVELGRRDAFYTEIVQADLKLGDRVVVRGNESLRPGQAVYVVEDYMVGGD